MKGASDKGDEIIRVLMKNYSDKIIFKIREQGDCLKRKINQHYNELEHYTLRNKKSR